MGYERKVCRIQVKESSEAFKLEINHFKCVFSNSHLLMNVDGNRMNLFVQFHGIMRANTLSRLILMVHYVRGL